MKRLTPPFNMTLYNNRATVVLHSSSDYNQSLPESHPALESHKHHIKRMNHIRYIQDANSTSASAAHGSFAQRAHKKSDLPQIQALRASSGRQRSGSAPKPAPSSTSTEGRLYLVNTYEAVFLDSIDRSSDVRASVKFHRLMTRLIWNDWHHRTPLAAGSPPISFILIGSSVTSAPGPDVTLAQSRRPPHSFASCRSHMADHKNQTAIHETSLSGRCFRRSLPPVSGDLFTYIEISSKAPK